MSSSIRNAALEQASQFRPREHCHFYLANNTVWDTKGALFRIMLVSYTLC